MKIDKDGIMMSTLAIRRNKLKKIYRVIKSLSLHYTNLGKMLIKKFIFYRFKSKEYLGAKVAAQKIIFDNFKRVIFELL